MSSIVFSLVFVLCGTIYPAFRNGKLKTKTHFQTFLNGVCYQNTFISYEGPSQLPCPTGWGRRVHVPPCTLPCVKGCCCVCVCSQSSMLQLVESGRYDTREDFSVVLQPFLLNTRLPVLEVCSPTPKLGLRRKNCYGHLCKRTTKAGMHVPPWHENKVGRPQGDMQMLC